MTNKEAINLLDNLIGMVEDNQNSDYDTALKMAIDALKQPERNEGKWTSEIHNRLMDETGGKAVCKNEHWGRKPDDFSEHMNQPED